MKSDRLSTFIAFFLTICIAVILSGCDGSAVTDADFEEGHSSLLPGETQNGEPGFRIGRGTLIIEDGPILSDGIDHPAWLVHLPAFKMFEPNIKPADRVIGMVENLRQIPGFDKNELDLSNCRGTLVKR